MTGPEHYSKAEGLVDLAQFGARDDINQQERQNMIAGAQVHATLALTAAKVDGTAMRQEDRTEWDRAMGRTEAAPDVV